MPNGKHRHVSFNSLTGGGSIYSTSDAAMQSALEGHYSFGRLFTLDKVVEDRPAEQPKRTAAPEPKTKKLQFSCLEDAKAYLVDNFGISRTKLRSKKQIEDAAKANNVEISIAE